MIDQRLRCSAIAFLAGVTAIAGCGPSGPTTYDFKGVVTSKGVPIELKMTESKAGAGAFVFLIKQDSADKEKKQANVAKDGTFVFMEGNKPTAGKYKVVVEWRDDHPLGPDKLKGKFDEQNSKVYCTIPDQKEITIDVSK